MPQTPQALFSSFRLHFKSQGYSNSEQKFFAQSNSFSRTMPRTQQCVCQVHTSFLTFSHLLHRQRSNPGHDEDDENNSEDEENNKESSSGVQTGEFAFFLRVCRPLSEVPSLTKQTKTLISRHKESFPACPIVLSPLRLSYFSFLTLWEKFFLHETRLYFSRIHRFETPSRFVVDICK